MQQQQQRARELAVRQSLQRPCLRLLPLFRVAPSLFSRVERTQLGRRAHPLCPRPHAETERNRSVRFLLLLWLRKEKKRGEAKEKKEDQEAAEGFEIKQTTPFYLLLLLLIPLPPSVTLRGRNKRKCSRSAFRQCTHRLTAAEMGDRRQRDRPAGHAEEYSPLFLFYFLLCFSTSKHCCPRTKKERATKEAIAKTGKRKSDRILRENVALHEIKTLCNSNNDSKRL